MKKLLCILSLFFLVNISCKTSTDAINTDDDSEPIFIYTKADSIEAIELAGWLCGWLLPTDSLISDVLYKLRLLRDTYGDSIAALDTSKRLLLPWFSRRLEIEFDSSTAALVKNNNYSGWDSLDIRFQPDSIVFILNSPVLAFLRFKEYIHPRRLAEIYSELPGIIYAGPNYRNAYPILWRYPWFPGWVDDKLTFLVPGNLQYYYFKYLDNQPVLIGKYDLVNDTVPYWWDEAKNTETVFWTWDGF